MDFRCSRPLAAIPAIVVAGALMPTISPARRDARRARHGRDHPRTADHAVQFVSFLAAYRHPGILPPMLAGTLGGLFATVHLCAVLSVDRSRRPVHRTIARQQAVQWCAHRHRRRCGRRHPQPRDLVRPSRLVPLRDAMSQVWSLVRSAVSDDRRCLSTRPLARRHGGDLPVQGRHDRHASRLLGRRDRPLSLGGDLMKRRGPCALHLFIALLAFTGVARARKWSDASGSVEP